MPDILPCIICKNKLESATPFDDVPHRGTQFCTRGHYGSTVFDPMDTSNLAVNICDDCLIKAGQDGHVSFYKQEPIPAPIRQIWRPDQ